MVFSSKQIAKLLLSLVLCTAGTGDTLSFADEKLKLIDLIQRALDHNPEVQEMKFTALAKRGEIGPAGAYEDPTLMFGALNYPVDSLSPRQMSMTGNEIGLTQKIPFPGKLTRRRNAVTEEYTARSKDFENGQITLIKSVKLAYFEWYLAEKKELLLKEQKNVIRQVISVSRSRFSLGQLPQAELVGFQVEEAGLIDQLLSADTQVRSRLLDLSKLVGQLDPPLQGQPDEIKLTELQLGKISGASLSERALRRNPSYQVAIHEEAASAARLSASKMGYLPDFELGAFYMFRQPSLEDRGTDLVSARVGLMLPLWFFSKQSEEVKSASADQSRAQARLDREQQSLRNLVEISYLELVEAKKRLELYTGGYLTLAKQAVDSAKPAYLSRKLEYAALLNNINNRFKAESGYYEAVARYESKIAILESLIGEPLETKQP